MEIKPHSFFMLSLPSHLVCLFFFILHYNLVFGCKFIWKSYVNFSFIELIFVMVKDTYLLTQIQYLVAENITQSLLNHRFQGEQGSYPLSTRLCGVGSKTFYPVHEPNLQTNHCPSNFFLSSVAARKVFQIFEESWLICFANYKHR